MPFLDRRDAGRKLAARLLTLREELPIVLALPRGGVPVAFEIAQELPAPLDLILARKLGAPGREELAIGAIAEGAEDDPLLDADLILKLRVAQSYVETARRAAVAEIERQRELFRGSRPTIEVRGRTVVLVDDGIATGLTALAALRMLRARKPARLVLAVPVGPGKTLRRLRHEVDQLLCLEKPFYFNAVSKSYKRFPQLGDQDVLDLLAEARAFAAN